MAPVFIDPGQRRARWVINVLPDRAAETWARWLKGNLGVEMIGRAPALSSEAFIREPRTRSKGRMRGIDRRTRSKLKARPARGERAFSHQTGRRRTSEGRERADSRFPTHQPCGTRAN